MSGNIMRSALFVILAVLAPACAAAGGDTSGVCGGIGDAACPEGQFCEKPAGRCGDVTARGLCTKKEEICTKEWNPVCGCDGKTYGNECGRLAAGVSRDHVGKCTEAVNPEDAQACGGLDEIACPDGQFCEKPAGQCGGLNVIGYCMERPEVCTREWNPVCGCDGKTYGNDCERKGAGVAGDYVGECEAPGQ